MTNLITNLRETVKYFKQSDSSLPNVCWYLQGFSSHYRFSFDPGCLYKVE
jgi:hypothetical protein